MLKRIVSFIRFFWEPTTYALFWTKQTWWLTFVLGAQKNRLIDKNLLNAHNICFQHGISPMTLHIIPSHFSRTGRHEATRPFICHIAPMEFHILDTSLHIKIESRKQFWPRSGPINRRVWSGSDLLVTLVVIFILIRLNNFLPTSVACWWHSPTDWTQIRLDTTLGLIWFQTVWYSDCNIRH